jgi:hypothetical protein
VVGLLGGLLGGLGVGLLGRLRSRGLLGGLRLLPFVALALGVGPGGERLLEEFEGGLAALLLVVTTADQAGLLVVLLEVVGEGPDDARVPATR